MKKIGRTIRRRRREGKTDYKLRFGLLKGDRPRVVVRITNKYVIGQVITTDIAQDKVIAAVHSKQLLNNGWDVKAKGSLKSRAAAYATGFLLAQKAQDIKGAIFDIGLARNIVGSRRYAFLKGAVDGGLDIPHGASVLPSDDLLASSKAGQPLIAAVTGGQK